MAVIKNIHGHQIDKEGKDSYKYGQAGAKISVTKNVHDETTIFLKEQISIEALIKWLSNSPYKIDLCFLEGFRNLNYPTILCLKEWDELTSQIDENVKIISGLICSNKFQKRNDLKIPIIDIQKDFNNFLSVFEIK